MVWIFLSPIKLPVKILLHPPKLNLASWDGVFSSQTNLCTQKINIITMCSPDLFTHLLSLSSIKSNTPCYLEHALNPSPARTPGLLTHVRAHVRFLFFSTARNPMRVASSSHLHASPPLLISTSVLRKNSNSKVVKMKREEIRLRCEVILYCRLKSQQPNRYLYTCGAQHFHGVLNSSWLKRSHVR